MQKGTQYAYTYTVEFSYPNLKLVHIIWISSFLKTKLDDREDRSVWIWLWKWFTDTYVKIRLIEYSLHLVIDLHNHRFRNFIFITILLLPYNTGTLICQIYSPYMHYSSPCIHLLWIANKTVYSKLCSLDYLPTNTLRKVQIRFAYLIWYLIKVVFSILNGYHYTYTMN